MPWPHSVLSLLLYVAGSHAQTTLHHVLSRDGEEGGGGNGVICKAIGT